MGVQKGPVAEVAARTRWCLSRAPQVGLTWTDELGKDVLGRASPSKTPTLGLLPSTQAAGSGPVLTCLGLTQSGTSRLTYPHVPLQGWDKVESVWMVACD